MTINWVDPTGKILDTLIDLGFIGYDLYRIVTDNILRGCDNLGLNLAALGADVGGALIPGATGLGLAVRTEKVSRPPVRRAVWFDLAMNFSRIESISLR